MTNSEPVIHVGILSSDKIEFILNGNFTMPNGDISSGKQQVVLIDEKILFNEKCYNEILLEPTSPTDSFDLIDVVIGIGFHWERKENQRFRGAIKLIVDSGQLIVINKINVEDYLTSVISSEMSATASDELLKAHAVISRSWVLYPIQRQEARGKSQESQHETINYQLSTINYTKWYERDSHTKFDVCADDHCQRYQGITRASTRTVEKAIEATRGKVLWFDGAICDARFSKSCGGATENFENCWEDKHVPYLTKIVDNPTEQIGFELDLTVEENAQQWIRKSPNAFCNTADKKVLAQVLNNYDQETADFYRWKVEYIQDDLSEIICRRSGIDFGEIVDLIPIERGESGRIIELKIVGTKQTVIVGKELEIRKWLSNSHLYSSAFVVDKSEFIDNIPQHFTLTGAGWGHGVGLCQIGAAVMGEKGYKYDEILLHYFRGAELKRIYP